MPELLTDILLSIHRTHCRRILRGEKFVEIRKSRPSNIDKCRIYLYETKADGGAGAVVGECFCYYFGEPQMPTYSLTIGSCLSMDQLRCYSKGKPIYGWYLSGIQRYEHPRPLSYFRVERAPQSWCYVNYVKESEVEVNDD